jgi:hypothetical protein
LRIYRLEADEPAAAAWLAQQSARADNGGALVLTPASPAELDKRRTHRLRTSLAQGSVAEAAAFFAQLLHHGVASEAQLCAMLRASASSAQAERMLHRASMSAAVRSGSLKTSARTYAAMATILHLEGDNAALERLDQTFKLGPQRFVRQGAVERARLVRLATMLRGGASSEMRAEAFFLALARNGAATAPLLRALLPWCTSESHVRRVVAASQRLGGPALDEAEVAESCASVRYASPLLLPQHTHASRTRTRKHSDEH